MCAPPPDSPDVLAIERQLLGYLLEAESAQEIAIDILHRVKQYRFQSAEHQVLFECVASLSTHPRQELQSLLPERLVRAGFPDFDLDRFIPDRRWSAGEAMGLCRILVPDEFQQH
ncbi:MAG: hypothetical protein HY316_08245 [Acidobacteria bacterium]|nr:hypothetical protein [Acidobacteriota bacterium]